MEKRFKFPSPNKENSGQRLARGYDCMVAIVLGDQNAERSAKVRQSRQRNIDYTLKHTQTWMSKTKGSRKLNGECKHYLEQFL